MKKVIYVLFLFSCSLLIAPVHASVQTGTAAVNRAPKPPAQVIQAARAYATDILGLTFYEIVYEKTQSVWTAYIFNAAEIPEEGGTPELPVDVVQFKSNGKQL